MSRSQGKTMPKRVSSFFLSQTVPGSASIAFGYPNALWGEPQSPVTEHERRSNMWNFIIGAMFGGMCGVGIVCLTVIGKRADEDMEHIEKKKETSALEGKVSE